MKFTQSSKKNSTFKNLSIDPETFAELRSESQRKYTFSLRFRIARNEENLRSIVVVTVKEKEPKNTTPGLTKKSSKIQTESVGLKDNLQVATIASKSALQVLDPSKSPLDGMSAKLKGKYLSGQQAQLDFDKKEDYIDKVEIPIPADLTLKKNQKYVITEMYIPSTNKKFVRPSKDLGVSPTDSIERINAELKLPMQCIVSPEVKDINSASNATFKRNFLSDYAQYFIEKVPSAPNENAYPVYATKIESKVVDFMEMKCSIDIDKKINRDVIVRFDLKEISTNLVTESLSFNLPINRHIDAFKCLSIPPVVVAEKQLKNNYNIIVDNKEPPGYVSGFNFYAREIDSQGNSTGYVSIGNRKNTGEIRVKYTPSEKLAIIRVVPTNYLGKETCVHSDVVIGAGHDAIGPMTIVVNNGDNGNAIDVYNVSRSATKLHLYRRDCGSHQNVFSLLQSQSRPKNSASGITFIDKVDLKNGSVYEYYVSASVVPTTFIPPNFMQTSNLVMQRYVTPSKQADATQVTISNPTTVNLAGDTVVSFSISTSLPQKENEKITDTIKTQIAEFYGKYLNPANNDNFPIGDSAGGIPEYKDLIIHEIVRTNLNTSTREVFPITTDGVFTDNEASRKVANISNVNPFYEYVYQVFTYRRNPIELFKKFVANGVDKSGKSWFYSPYKWKNPLAQAGKLYADDNEGMPIIEEYESLTSDPLGTTAIYKTSGAGQYTKLKDVSATRVDVNTIKVTWDTTGSSALYDSFIVMKVVNGIRYLLGSSRVNYIYHELNSSDVGDVYYIVLPIMFDYDMDEPDYTNHVIVSPVGITPVTLSKI